MVSSSKTRSSQPCEHRRQCMRFWLCWFLSTLAVFALRLPTLTIYPAIETDEVWMLDIGRTTLNPHTDWSVNWVPPKGPPQHWVHGPVLMELTYRLFPGSPLGPRAFALIGAILAATFLVAWLRERGVESRAVWLMGIAFLLDPILSESYGGARVDCWAFALCICSAWLVRKRYDKASRTRADFAAGALAATALMIWPTSGILYPLLLTELWDAHTTGGPESRRASSAARRVATAALGGCAAIAVLVIPAVGRLSAIGDFARVILPGNLSPMRSPGQGWLLANLMGLFGPFGRSPFIIAAAFLGAVFSRQRSLTVATVVCMLFFLGTMGFATRAIYLLPYFAALATALFSDGLHSTGRKAVRYAAALLLVCAAIWAIGLSLVARTGAAWRNRSLKSPETLFSVADSMIGPGGYRVVVQPYEFYYAGRRLGWRMLRPLGALGDNSVKNPQWKALLQDADYAILRGAASDSQTLDILGQSGLVRKSVLLDRPKPAPLRILGIPFRTAGDLTYGPYTIYARRVRSGEKQGCQSESIP